MKEKIKLKISYFRHSICMMLDDTRCGLDTSSLHRDTSIDISLYKKFELLSCHRDTLNIIRNKKMAKSKILDLANKNKMLNHLI